MNVVVATCWKPTGGSHTVEPGTPDRDVPADKCGFGHTAMIQFGREYCTARDPACLDDPEACPLVDLCDQVGVDPMAGDAVDPDETLE